MQHVLVILNDMAIKSRKKIIFLNAFWRWMNIMKKKKRSWEYASKISINSSCMLLILYYYCYCVLYQILHVIKTIEQKWKWKKILLIIKRRPRSTRPYVVAHMRLQISLLSPHDTYTDTCCILTCNCDLFLFYSHVYNLLCYSSVLATYWLDRIHFMRMQEVIK